MVAYIVPNDNWLEFLVFPKHIALINTVLSHLVLPQVAQIRRDDWIFSILKE